MELFSQLRLHHPLLLQLLLLHLQLLPQFFLEPFLLLHLFSLLKSHLEVKIFEEPIQKGNRLTIIALHHSKAPGC